MDRPKKSRSELKREAIIQAATDAFKQHGVANTSMDKLAQLAQVSKRTVYNHFKTKEDLVMHLLSDLWEQAMVQVDFPYQPEQPLEEQLKSLVEMEVNFISAPDYIDLARVAFGHLFYHPDALQKELEKISCQETAVHRWLQAAMDDSRLIKQDVFFANTQLHALIKGVCFWPQLMGFSGPLTEEQTRQLVDETVAMFLARYQKS